MDSIDMRTNSITDLFTDSFTDKCGSCYLNLIDSNKEYCVTGKNNNNNYFCSKECLDKFKKSNITPSILWGQKNTGTSVHYSTKTDTWTVYNDEEQIHSLKDLKNAYKIVKIADGDELWIEDERIK